MLALTGNSGSFKKASAPILSSSPVKAFPCSKLLFLLNLIYKLFILVNLIDRPFSIFDLCFIFSTAPSFLLEVGSRGFVSKLNLNTLAPLILRK